MDATPLTLGQEFSGYATQVLPTSSWHASALMLLTCWPCIT